MAVINLIGQAVLESDIKPKLESLQSALDEYKIFWERLPEEKKMKLLESKKLPLLNDAWENYKYLKKFFENEEINDKISKSVIESPTVINK